jgi:Ca2+-binding RTX toxin-like protein
MSKESLMSIAIGITAAAAILLLTELLPLTAVWAANIIGTDQNDALDVGTDERDHIRGLGGEDTIGGHGENDLLQEDDDNDEIEGDGGDDRIQGGRGNDIVRGGDNNDILQGGSGDDILSGDRGTFGVRSADRFDCGQGTDRIVDFNKVEGDMKAANCEIVEQFPSSTQQTSPSKSPLGENRTGAEEPTPSVNETIDILEQTPKE